LNSLGCFLIKVVKTTKTTKIIEAAYGGRERRALQRKTGALP